MRIGIIACESLSSELQHIFSRWGQSIEITFLPAFLDMYPSKLHRLLDQKLSSMSNRFDLVVVVYGKCCLLIEDIVNKYNARKIKGDSCYDILAGKEILNQLEDEEVYFITPFICRNFEKVVREGFGSISRMKERLTKCNRLVYLDTGLDDKLILKARREASGLGIPIEIYRVGLHNLETRLIDVLKSPINTKRFIQ